MNIWDLIVKISGNGQGLRDDIDKDIASLEELNATELKDKNAIVDLDTAEASIKLDALNGKMSELENTMANVTLDDTDAQLKLDALKAELKSLKDARVTAKLSDEEFKLKLDDLRARFAELCDKTVTVKVDSAGATVGIDTVKTELGTLPEEKRVAIRLTDFIMPQVEIVKTELDDLPDEKAIDIKVYDAEIISETSLVRAELDDLPSHKVIDIEFKTDGYEKAKAEEESLDNGNGGSGFFSWLHRRNGGSGGNRKLGRAGMIGAVIAALAPAASPLGGALVGGAGGLASSAVPGLLGVLGFGAVAKTNIGSVTNAVSQYNTNMKAASQATTIAQQNTDIAKAELAWRGLSQAQLNAAHSLQNFESFWKQFAISFQNPVLTLFSNGMKLLQNVLIDVKPAISGTASAFTTLMKDAGTALQSPFWKQWFGWVNAQAKPSVMSFWTIVGNLTKGFAGLLQAFQPMATAMEKGLISMSAEFAKWGTHLKGTKDFESFLKYAAQSGKAVLGLIGNLAHLIGTLLKNFEPLGLTMVTFVSDLAKFINQLLRTNPIVKVLVDLFLGGLQNVLQFVDGVVKLTMWLGKAHPRIMDIITAVGVAIGVWKTFTAAMVAFDAASAANPIGFIIAGIAALIAVVVELVKHWKTVVQWLKDVWNWFNHLGVGAKAALTLLAPWLVFPAEIIAHWKPIKTFFEALWKNITNDAQKAWRQISQYLKGYWDALKGAFKVFVDLLTGQWGKAWADMKSTLQKVWNDIKNTTLGGMLTDARRWGSNLIRMMAEGIMSSVHWITNAVSRVANTIHNFLAHHSPAEQGPLANDDEWMPNMMNMFVQGIQQAAPKLQSALNNALSMPQWAVSPGVASMVQSGGLTVQHIHSGQVGHTHDGSVMWGKPDKQTVNYIEQQIYRNGVSRGL